MPAKISSATDAIIVFDIRNFSCHRQILARSSAGRPLTRLVKALLERAVDISSKYSGAGKNTISLLNHTGDGFVLVLRGSSPALHALYFASEFREIAGKELVNYHEELRLLAKTQIGLAKLPKLAFGMGLHTGAVTVFEYASFGGTIRHGFIGSAVNVACRVEACTKDHPDPVICTSKLKARARRQFRNDKSAFERYFASMGPHFLRGLEGTEDLISCLPGFHLLGQAGGQ